MSVIKLEVGKLYRNQLGETVEIVSREFLTTHQYLGSDGEYYRYNGRVGFFRRNDLDLIEETEDKNNMRPSAWGRVFAGMVDGSYTKAA